MRFLDMFMANMAKIKAIFIMLFVFIKKID